MEQKQIEVINQSGQVVNSLQLPIPIANSSFSPLQVSLAYRSYQKNQHQATKKVKTRGEVRGSTRKIYRQKGTGGARHGSRYAPQFRGGGVAFGPTGQKSGPLKVNQKFKKKVLYSILGEKFRQKQLIVIDKLKLNNYKTKEAEKILTDLLCKDLKSQVEKLKLEIQALKTVPNKTIEPKKELVEKERELSGLKKIMKQKQKTKKLIILSHQEERKTELIRSFRNLPAINKISDSQNLSFGEAFNSNYLIFTVSALTELTERPN